MFELARHLTDRDREIALRLYDQQVLRTDQLALLYFSSRRRAQDRLLFLYRERVVDRFYPPSPFGTGKPQAHWLLDEAGAILVAAILRVERKRLGWRRRDDWASHPQLAHRLEVNRCVCDLVAATLPDPTLGVTGWYSSRDAAGRLGMRDLLRPDAGFVLEAAGGLIECYLEWDRGTEPQARLTEKLDHYRLAEGRLHGESEMRNVLFVVPGQGRVETLRRAYAAFAPEPERHRQDLHLVNLDGCWPLLAATVPDIRSEGALGAVWQSITDGGERRRTLTQLPARGDLRATDLGRALGRRWRKERSDFWERLSPLGRQCRERAAEAATPAPRPDPDTEAFLERLRRRREAEQEEIRRDVAAYRARSSIGPGGEDLPASRVDGLIDDPEDEEQPWR